MPRRSAAVLVLALGAALLCRPTLTAAGPGGACCMFDMSCAPAASESACNATGGVFLPGDDCADDPCGVGACCDGLSCGITDAFSCIAAGRTFAGVGVTCFDDPCAAGVGACCLGGGSCMDISPEACSSGGGTWLGAGTNCAQGSCAAGACCFPGNCSQLLVFECSAAGGAFVAGGDCMLDPCNVPNACPLDALFGQSPDSPDGFSAGTSEESTPFTRWDDFSGVGGPIEALTWFGLDLDHVGGTNFVECVEVDPTFTINFHDDAGGVPGALVCSYKVVATRTPTGIDYLGAEMNQYDATLPVPCVMVSGWVSIVGLGNPECWFLWMSAGGGGTSYCEGCGSPEDVDLSFCLLGTPGGVFGACCDDATGICQDGVEISDCAAADLRFEPGALCSELSPPCGIVLGACCLGDATCSIEMEEDCAKAGGSWLGADSLCSQCPCIVPCPPGAVAEGEQDCFDGYVDVTNGGCTSAAGAVSPISLGTTVCGTGGVYISGGDAVPEFDWYEVIVPTDLVLGFTVEAEFEVRAWIYDAAGGCPGVLLTTADTTPCAPLSLIHPVDPGPYWLVVAASTFTDEAACGAGYVASVTVVNPCAADFDANGVVGFADLNALLASWGPCPGCPEDLDGNGVVGFTDLNLLLAAWGPCAD